MKKDAFEKTLTYTEILNYAIMHLVRTYPKAIECIKNGSFKNPEMRHSLMVLYAPWLFKIRTMCEIYKLDTGKDYELEAYCGIKPEDIDLDE